MHETCRQFSPLYHVLKYAVVFAFLHLRKNLMIFNYLSRSFEIHFGCLTAYIEDSVEEFNLNRSSIGWLCSL